MWKMSYWKVFFSWTGPFLFFFLICVICLLRAGWILFKTENLPLFYEFLTDLCYAYKLHADAFATVIPLNFFRATCEFVLSLETLELVQNKNSLSSYSLRFSSGLYHLSSQITLAEKLPRKCSKLTNWWLRFHLYK